MKKNKKVIVGTIAGLVALAGGYVGFNDDIDCLTADYKYELGDGQYYCVDDKDIDNVMKQKDKVKETMIIYKANGAFADKIKDKLKTEYNKKQKDKDNNEYDFDIMEFDLVHEVLFEEMKEMSVKDGDKYLLSGITAEDGTAVIKLDTKQIFEDLIINK